MSQIERDDGKVFNRVNINGSVGIEQHAASLYISWGEGSATQAVKRLQLRLYISGEKG